MTDQTKYSERESAPGEEDRGKVLDALAGGLFWAFLRVEIDEGGGLSLKLEADDRMDTDTLKALLNRTLELLP
jgi:hypothetical protein